MTNYEYIHNDEEVIKKREANTHLISTINQIEGFSPEAEARAFENNGTITSGIAKNVKETWFRLKHPQGCVVFEVVSPSPSLPQTEQLTSALVEVKCSVYASASDTWPLGQGVGFAFAEDYDLENSIPRKFATMVRIAKGEAEAKAYYAAGFGLQFYGDTDFDELKNMALNQPAVESKSEATATNDHSAELVAPSSFVVDPSTVPLSVAPVVEKEETKGKRRTDMEIYNDAINSLREIKPTIESVMEKLMVTDSDSEKDMLNNKLDGLRNDWNKQAEVAMTKYKALSKRKTVEHCSLPEFDLDYDVQFGTAKDNTFAYAEAYLTTQAEADQAIEKGLSFEAEQVFDNNTTAVSEDVPDTTISEPTPAIAEAPLGEQMELVGTVTHPEDVICSIDIGDYRGKPLKTIMESKGKSIVIWMLNKNISSEEKEACMSIIRDDEELRAQAERKGISV